MPKYTRNPFYTAMRHGSVGERNGFIPGGILSGLLARVNKSEQIANDVFEQSATRQAGDDGIFFMTRKKERNFRQNLHSRHGEIMWFLKRGAEKKGRKKL